MSNIQAFISHLEEDEGLTPACSCCSALVMGFQQTPTPITTAKLLVISIKTPGKTLYKVLILIRRSPFLQVKLRRHDTKSSLSHGSVADCFFQAANLPPILSSTRSNKGCALVCHRIWARDYSIHLKKPHCKSTVFKTILISSVRLIFKLLFCSSCRAGENKYNQQKLLF